MKKIILATAILHVSLFCYSQNIEKGIDKIFTEWNNENHPGGVVSILKKNKVLFSKAYGYANIKYNVPINKETIFNIGSVSKQFTAMAIVLLHLDGKLSIDDDIRKHLPQLFEFENKITIRHLLHHTSGFRSTPELFALAGWRDGDAITTDDDFQYFYKQTSLNFTPGSQFMYTNSGYVLLAKIIETVSGENYSKWIDEHIFTPLNMTNTFVDESNSNTVPEIATPYNQFEPEQFTIGENMSLDIGASNIYTTANDLGNWMKNFYSPTKGWEKAFSLLQTTDKLNNGELNSYAFGVLIDDFYGNNRIQHTGGVPGFLSYIAYYPNEELTIVLLTNFTSYEVNDKYMQLSQLFLKNKTSKPEKLKKPLETPLDLVAAKSFSGDYWNINKNYARKIYVQQDTLWYMRANGVKSHLVHTGDNKFIMGGIKATVNVEFETGAKNKMIVTDGDKPSQLFEEYDSTPLTPSEKDAYIGSFYSPELETTYRISLINNQLIGYHSRHGEFPIRILKRDITDWSGMAIVKYKRNEKGKIIGFYVDMNRVENVWFQKK